ncbi:MAG: hypothetical protein ACOCVC_08755 [Spirochaeta sp.]
MHSLKRITRFVYTTLLFLTAVSFLTASDYIHSVDPEDYPASEWEHGDRDADGETDYVALQNSQGRMIQEAYDVNYDGLLDDFYFYDEGELIRRELDTVHDGQIDMWVYLVQGHLIEEIRRDTTGDGEADFVRKYSE